ncbi:MAG: hypothetical protein GY769_08210 [bacterium]|nr:hypothetical protein [bacterium]
MSRLWVAALVPCATLGCMGYSVPKPLTPAENRFVQSTEGSLVAGIRSFDSGDIDAADYSEAFRDSIRATDFFSQIDFDWALEEEPDVFIRPLHPCDLAEEPGGGFVPIFPMLTLGIVPQIVRGSYHWAFTISRGEHSVTVDCPIRGAFAMGWIPMILTATPRWATEPEAHPKFTRRLSFELSQAVAALPARP